MIESREKSAHGHGPGGAGGTDRFTGPESIRQQAQRTDTTALGGLTAQEGLLSPAKSEDEL